MHYWTKVLQLQEQMAELRKLHYFHEVIGTYQWWILIASAIVLWTLWVVLLDRSRLRNILIVGVLTLGFTMVLDDIGLTLGLWNYPYKVVYIVTRFNSVDMVVLPIAYMLIYQYCRGWGKYVICCALFCAFAAFVAEPIFVHLDMYAKIHWKFIYSFPIYWMIGLVVKGMADLSERLERKARMK